MTEGPHPTLGLFETAVNTFWPREPGRRVAAEQSEVASRRGSNANAYEAPATDRR